MSDPLEVFMQCMDEDPHVDIGIHVGHCCGGDSNNLVWALNFFLDDKDIWGPIGFTWELPNVFGEIHTPWTFAGPLFLSEESFTEENHDIPEVQDNAVVVSLVPDNGQEWHGSKTVVDCNVHTAMNLPKVRVSWCTNDQVFGSVGQDRFINLYFSNNLGGRPAPARR